MIIYIVIIRTINANTCNTFIVIIQRLLHLKKRDKKSTCIISRKVYGRNSTN
jgi:hypothetical protein